MKQRNGAAKTYFRMLSYMLPYKSRLAATIILSVLVAGLFGGSILALQPLGDALLGDRDKPDGIYDVFDGALWQTEPGQHAAAFIKTYLFTDRYHALFWVSVLLIVVTGLRGLARFFQDYLAAYISLRVTVDVSNEMYDRALRLPISFLDAQGVGKSMARFTNDVNLVSRGMVDVCEKVIREPLKVLVALSLVFSTNWRLALLAIVGFPAIAGLLAWFGKRVKRATSRMLEKRSRLVALLQETFFGIRIVKAFVMEKHELERFRNENLSAFRSQLRIAKAQAAATPVMEFFTVLGVAAFFVVGGRNVLAGEMSKGMFLMFIGGLALMFDPARKLSKIYNNIQLSVASAERVFSYMDTMPEACDSQGAPELPKMKHHIAFHDVCFSYDGAEPVLTAVNLDVKLGEMVAIVGFSGAGKSTLMSLVPRFYEATSGRITIDGTDIRDASLLSLRRQIGIVPQENVLFKDSVRNNICYGEINYSEERMIAAAKAAYAHNFIMKLPEGYDTVIGERGTTLSGGECQRLAIARAILKDPAILILDEATSSLDSESEQAIQSALDTFVKGRTTFVIAHRLSTVMKADRIVVIDKGRIVEIGKHQELLAADGVYKRLYETQFAPFAQ
jgi:subfamily B ATP-binding cassette protein MsbA